MRNDVCYLFCLLIMLKAFRSSFYRFSLALTSVFFCCVALAEYRRQAGAASKQFPAGRHLFLEGTIRRGPYGQPVRYCSPSMHPRVYLKRTTDTYLLECSSQAVPASLLLLCP